MDKDSRIVFPGEMISDKPERIGYAYIDNDRTFSTVVGLFSEGKLVPLEGPYEPLPEDVIVGIISEVRFSGYSVDINCPYTSFLSSREIRERYEMGDAIIARIVKVDEMKNIDLADAKKLPAGNFIKVSSVKVPRIIGKKNSMIDMLQSATGCQITPGRNGYIWISGKGDASLAQKAIRMIETQAHTRGLTDRVAAFLKSQKQ
jgi:exosome complex component RRP4